jgi:hypothetical protein
VANIVEIIIKGVDKTKDGFTGAINNLGDFEKRIGQVTPFLTGLATAAVAAFGAMARHSINAADEMGRLAQSAGVTVEQFSGLAVAAGDSDVEVGKLNTGLGQLSKNIVEAIDPASQAAETFKGLGINVRDAAGNLISTQDAFLQITDKISKMEDGAEKTALSMKLFGKAGAEMIPFLNQGAEAIRRTAEESQALGLTFSTETATAANELNDNLDKLGQMSMGIVNLVVAEFLPAMAEWTTSLVEWVKQSGIVQASAGTLIDIFKVLIYVGKLCIATFKGMYDALVLVGNLIGNVFSNLFDWLKIFGNGLGSLGAAIEQLFQGNFAAAKEIFHSTLGGMETDYQNFKAGLKETSKQVVADFKEMNADLASAGTGPELGLGVNISKTVETKEKGPAKRTITHDTDWDQISQQSDAALGKMAQTAEEMSNKLAAASIKNSQSVLQQKQVEFQTQLDAIAKLNVAEEDYYKLREQAAQNYNDQVAQLAEQQAAQIRQLNETLNNEAAEARIAELQANTDSWNAQFEAKLNIVDQERALEQQRYQERLKQISDIGAAEEENLKLVETAHRAYQSRVTALQRQENEVRKQNQLATAGAMGSIFGNMAEVAKAFGKKGHAAYKAFATAEAIVSTYLAANKALASAPPPLNYVLAAAVTAAGLANVAKINSSEPAAHGGLDYVPAETTYLLQAGERVVSPRQNQDLTDFLENGGVAPGQAIHLHNYIDGRELSETVYQMSRDGRLQVSTRALV